MSSLFLTPDNYSQLSAALASDKWVVACLCAAWCDVCKQYRAGFDAIAAEHPAHQFVWIDVEDQCELVGDLDVENFPTILIQRSDTVAFYGTMLPEPRQVSRLLQAQLEKTPAMLAQEASSSTERQQWQRDCNLRTLLAAFTS